jgi:tetratricopeptide (TPR) repeat protein
MRRGVTPVADLMSRSRETALLYESLLQLDDRYFGALCRTVNCACNRASSRTRNVAAAVKVDKRSGDSHQLLAFALTGLGHIQKAVRSYEKAIAIRPDFCRSPQRSRVRLKDWSGSTRPRHSYEKAAAIRPAYHEAHTNFGNVL